MSETNYRQHMKETVMSTQVYKNNKGDRFMFCCDMNVERGNAEYTEKWRELCKAIPPLHFKPEWEVTIVPPFGGAIARFRVAYGDKGVSVYLDPFTRLGCMSEPYWEIYPYAGDIKRYFIGEEDEMMKDIEDVLNGKDGEENA